MRSSVGGKAVERGGGSSSQSGRLETDLLAIDESLAAPAELPGLRIDRIHNQNPPKLVALDIDSSVSRKKVLFCAADTCKCRSMNQAARRWLEDPNELQVERFLGTVIERGGSHVGNPG